MSKKKTELQKITPTEKDKILIAKLLLKITFVMILISVGLKILGFNYFNADKNNIIFSFIASVADYKFNIFGYEEKFLKIIILILIMVTQIFIIFRLSCANKNLKAYYLATLFTTIITLVSQTFIYNYLWRINPQLVYIARLIVEFLLLIMVALIIDIKQKNKAKVLKPFPIKLIITLWNKAKKPIFILAILLIYQLIVMFLRNITFIASYESVYHFLLNFDYMILLIATYYIFIKKENNLNVGFEFDSITTKLLNEKPSKDDLKDMIKNIKKGYVSFKGKDLEEKIAEVIYILLFIIQEILTLSLLIFFAIKFHYLIECLFILTSFLISKSVFGAFHFKSFFVCFFVSNTTFALLGKLTMNVEYTLVIPIMCGIGLSYIASRFIKKNNVTPYRGMPENDLSEICKIKELNKMETEILIDFYCKKFSETKIALKLYYSDRQIRRIKTKALERLTT